MPTNSSALTFRQLRVANAWRLPHFKKCVDWTPAQWLQALVGEVGEYANWRKKFERGDIDAEVFLREAGKELADVQCYLDLLAYQIGIDLGRATVEKFNEVSDRIGSNIYLEP